MLKHRKYIFLFFAISIMTLSATFALAETHIYKNKSGACCKEQRVDYGAAVVTCSDAKGDILANWVCEYELEYSCRNTLTGEVQKGGFDPLSDSLCTHLCGFSKEDLK